MAAVREGKECTDGIKEPSFLCTHAHTRTTYFVLFLDQHTPPIVCQLNTRYSTPAAPRLAPLPHSLRPVCALCSAAMDSAVFKSLRAGTRFDRNRFGAAMELFETGRACARVRVCVCVHAARCCCRASMGRGGVETVLYAVLAVSQWRFRTTPRVVAVRGGLVQGPHHPPMLRVVPLLAPPPALPPWLLCWHWHHHHHHRHHHPRHTRHPVPFMPPPTSQRRHLTMCHLPRLTVAQAAAPWGM